MSQRICVTHPSDHLALDSLDFKQKQHLLAFMSLPSFGLSQRKPEWRTLRYQFGGNFRKQRGKVMCRETRQGRKLRWAWAEEDMSSNPSPYTTPRLTKTQNLPITEAIIYKFLVGFTEGSSLPALCRYTAQSKAELQVCIHIRIT